MINGYLLKFQPSAKDAEARIKIKSSFRILSTAEKTAV